MTKFKWILVLALCFILTGCKQRARPNSVSDDTLVQVTWKWNSYVKELEIYVPEKAEYYEIYVSETVYHKVKVGSWVELGDLKEKVNLDD